METGVNEACQIAPLALAFLGDSVYDLYVRTALVKRGISKSGQLHDLAKRYVNAAAQAELVSILETKSADGISDQVANGFSDRLPFVLTETERDIIRRGRNAKPKTTTKHASVHDYHAATGFEALLGYLYLTGQEERIAEIVEIGMKEEY